MKSHDVYIGSLKLPVAPSSISAKEKGRNKTYDLINGEVLNVLKKQGLTEFSFSFLLPSSPYPWADSFTPPFEFYAKLEKMMKEKKVMPLIIIRHVPGLINSIIDKTTIEALEWKEDAKNGTNLVVDIKMKRYVPLKTKKLEIKEENGKAIMYESSKKDNPSTDSFRIGENETLSTAMRRNKVDMKNFDRIVRLNGISNPNDVREGALIRCR